MVHHNLGFVLFLYNKDVALKGYLMVHHNIGFVLCNSRVLVFRNMVYQGGVRGFLFPFKIFS